jgi:hypothetical protein
LQFCKWLYRSRSIRRWAAGSRPVPREGIILFRLLRARRITLDDIAAAVRGLEPVVEPLPEPGVGIDELNSRVCHWPLWGNESGETTF